MRLMWMTWLVVAALWSAPAQAERLKITVGGASFRPYPIAAPDLVLTGGDPAVGAQLGKELGLLLQTDLDMARSLELVPPNTYLAPQKELWNNPTYANWAAVGASGLVRGGVETDGKSSKVTLRFYDVTAQREALTRSCVQELAQSSQCVHRFVDEVVEYLTGEKGIFSSRIAFAKRVGKGKSVFTCDVDGGNMVRVTENPELNLLPSWSPNGQFLFLTSYINGNPDLFRINLVKKRLEPLSAQRGLNTGAAMSPDGKRIALTLSMDGNTEIYVMDWDGKHLTRLTDNWGQDVSPTWSPDGSRIAFVSSRSGNPHIYVMNADGGNPRRLTFQGNYNQEPDWSPRPDGQIAFTARDEQLKYDVFLVHPDSGVITRLTQDDGHNESPSHSPDGHHLVFTSTRGPERTRQLYVMDVDGNNQRKISRQSGEYETPSWGPRLGYN